MMLVIETDAGFDPAADPAFHEALQQYNLHPAGEPLVFGEYTFYYFDVAPAGNADEITTALLGMPGVQSAYFKPDGAPPAL